MSLNAAVGSAPRRSRPRSRSSSPMAFSWSRPRPTAAPARSARPSSIPTPPRAARTRSTSTSRARVSRRSHRSRPCPRSRPRCSSTAPPSRALPARPDCLRRPVAGEPRPTHHRGLGMSRFAVWQPSTASQSTRPRTRACSPWLHAQGPATQLSLRDSQSTVLVQSQGVSSDSPDHVIDEQLEAGNYSLACGQRRRPGRHPPGRSCSCQPPRRSSRSRWGRTPVPSWRGTSPATAGSTWPSPTQTPTVSRCCWATATARSSPRSPTRSGSNPVAIVAGDFTGDGHLDLAVADSYCQRRRPVLLGNGDGTFQPAVDLRGGVESGCHRGGGLHRRRPARPGRRRLRFQRRLGPAGQRRRHVPAPVTVCGGDVAVCPRGRGLHRRRPPRPRRRQQL